MVELAIFGSLIILTLGVLVKHGLDADSTQQAMMEGFRNAMVSTVASTEEGTPVTAFYLSIRDRRNVDPSALPAIGQSSQTVARASSGVRTYLLPLTPESVEELARVYTTMQGNPVNCPRTGSGCLVADFRPANITDDNIAKFREIYGFPNVDQDRQTVIDACEGEVIDFFFCYRQGVQIVDAGVCGRECERGKPPESPVDCNAVCAQDIGTPPWYAQGAVRGANGLWQFPALNTLFANLPTTAFGFQPGVSRLRVLRTGLVKDEDTTKISTRLTTDFHEETARTFAYRDPQTSTVAAQAVKTSVNQQADQTWTTPW